jgi:dTDP-4-amino-4,6-dideoxygalactose transaminase
VAKLAINGGPRLRQASFHGWPVVGDETVDAVTDVLRSARWNRRRGGTRTAEFEQEFARYHDCAYGLCVSNGTAALEVAVRAAGVEIGDEVIVPPYSFMATASAPLQVGAVPVFVDIDPETYNINPALIEQHITDKTRAIFAVHFGGMAADMDAINAIARKHNLLVLEDCAHAHGGRHAQGKLGSLGDAAGFSFQASKNLTSGEGGCVTTNNEDIYKRAVYAHDFWRSHVDLEDDDLNDPSDTQFPVLSWNYRMSEIMGAILHSQLGNLEEWAARRDANFRYLTGRLAEIEGLANVRVDPFVERNALHIFIFKYMDADAFAGAPRELVARAVAAEGIPCSAGYVRPLHKHPLFQDALHGALRSGFPLTSHYYGREMDYRQVECPAAERLCREETLWIGHPAFLGATQDMDDIADAFVKVKENAAELRSAAVVN